MEANSKGIVNYNISGLLLCAGLSGRMGTLKALMLHNGLPFTVLIIKKLLLVCKEVIVVIGHESEKVKSGIKKILNPTEIAKVIFILNENYKDGMFKSLQCGLEHTSNADWILYHFVDQPSIPQSFYLEFVNHLSDDINWLQPTYSGKPGHPILFNNDVSLFILEKSIKSSLREVSKDKRIIKFSWDCNYPEVLQDIDTIEEYNSLNFNYQKKTDRAK